MHRSYLALQMALVSEDLQGLETGAKKDGWLGIDPSPKIK
jgi:hypothetical protein